MGKNALIFGHFLIFFVPPLLFSSKKSEKSLDFAIELAGLVSAKLANFGQSKGGKKTWAGVSAEERSARAKKAAAARWKKKKS